MNTYYIEHACGNFIAPIEYADKTEAEILNDILVDYPEFMTIARFDSEAEAEKAYSKYHNNICVRKNGDRTLVDYHIYSLEKEE